MKLKLNVFFVILIDALLAHDYNNPYFNTSYKKEYSWQEIKSKVMIY